MVTFQEIKKMGEKWAAEYCKALNNSPEYQEAAKGWGVGFEGAMLFIMTGSGEITFDIFAFVDLKDGKCLGIKILEPGESPPRPPGFKLKAPMLTWRRLAFKEQNPVQALMTGELELEGDMDIVMRYAEAAMLLADITEKTDRALFTSFYLGE